VHLWVTKRGPTYKIDESTEQKTTKMANFEKREFLA